MQEYAEFPTLSPRKMRIILVAIIPVQAVAHDLLSQSSKN